MKRKLNIGCGRDIKDNYVNLDIANLEGVDVVHNLEQLPLPFSDDHFEEILCKDVLEHVEYIPLLKELHRILKKDGKLVIRVPHFTSWNNFGDPTHKKQFSHSTFGFFVKSNQDRSYYFDFTYERVDDCKITFNRMYFWAAWLINAHPTCRHIYESTFIRNLIPAQNIEVILVK
jgi:SAM-dependent methyltransferase